MSSTGFYPLLSFKRTPAVPTVISSSGFKRAKDPSWFPTMQLSQAALPFTR